MYQAVESTEMKTSAASHFVQPFSGGLSKFRMAALRIALLVISSSAVEIPSADWILVRVLRRSPSVEFNSDNEFSFVPEGDCNPEPSLMFTGTSLPGLLEADDRGVINLATSNYLIHIIKPSYTEHEK